jgi:hypothetical protein
MKRWLALFLACSIATRALADETPDLVLAEDGAEATPPPEQPPVHKIEAYDQPDLAFADAADPNPGSGRGQILAGWIASGIGVAGVAQAPLCRFNDFDRGRGLRRCRNVGIVFGVLGLSLGVPWLVFGYQKRRAQRQWKQRHGLTALPELQFAGDSLWLTLRF